MNTIKLNTIGEVPIKKGGASGGGGGNYVYYSIANDFNESILLASILKVNADSAIIFMPIGGAMGSGSFNPEDIMGVGFDLSMKMTDPKSGELVPVGDVIAEPSKDWTQITEEEFYKIPTQFITRLGGSYEDISYMYDEGMTWRDWINSNYNNIGAFISDWDSVVWKTPEGYNCTFYPDEDGSTKVKPNDLIVSQVYYPVIDG